MCMPVCVLPDDALPVVITVSSSSQATPYQKMLFTHSLSPDLVMREKRWFSDPAEDKAIENTENVFNELRSNSSLASDPGLSLGRPLHEPKPERGETNCSTVSRTYVSPVTFAFRFPMVGRIDGGEVRRTYSLTEWGARRGKAVSGGIC